MCSWQFSETGEVVWFFWTGPINNLGDGVRPPDRGSAHLVLQSGYIPEIYGITTPGVLRCSFIRKFFIELSNICLFLLHSISIDFADHL